MHCRNCNNDVSPEAIACMKCGVPPLKGKNFCNNCGASTHPEAILCVSCGVAFSMTSQAPTTAPINISTDPLVKTWGKYSYVNYIVILLFSALPFVNVKCTNNKVESVTGLNLAIGAERKFLKTETYTNSLGYERERLVQAKETLFSWELAIFYVFMLITLGCLLFGSTSKKYRTARITSNIGLVSLVVWFIYVNIKVSQHTSRLYEITFGSGLWLTLATLILTLILLTNYIKKYVPKSEEIVGLDEGDISTDRGNISESAPTVIHPVITKDVAIIEPSFTSKATGAQIDIDSNTLNRNESNGAAVVSQPRVAAVTEVTVNRSSETESKSLHTQVDKPQLESQHTLSLVDKQNGGDDTANMQIEAQPEAEVSPSDKWHKVLTYGFVLLVISGLVWFFVANMSEREEQNQTANRGGLASTGAASENLSNTSDVYDLDKLLNSSSIDEVKSIYGKSNLKRIVGYGEGGYQYVTYKLYPGTKKEIEIRVKSENEKLIEGIDIRHSSNLPEPYLSIMGASLQKLQNLNGENFKLSYVCGEGEEAISVDSWGNGKLATSKFYVFLEAQHYMANHDCGNNEIFERLSKGDEMQIVSSGEQELSKLGLKVNHIYIPKNF
jgi:competence protein ComGC